VRPPLSLHEALDYLYRDPFPNASLIGAVEQGASQSIEVKVAEAGAVRGVLVIGPGPEEIRSVGLDADDAAAAEALLRALRPGERLQFGLHRPESVAVLNRVCRVSPTGVMLAYRCDGPWLSNCGFLPARELTRTDERVVRRSRDEAFLMSFLQAAGGKPRRPDSEVRAFGVVEGGRLLARCLTTWATRGIERQIGTVWSVFTDPTLRGRGLGRAVVAAATAAILDSGRVARYFAFSDNLPSIRICQSLGYTQDHAVQFFRGERR
jgi:GNAT superfamily N-acetyltransferase